ncbi:MAG: hypothetical protein ACSHX3_10485 [Litorimonas sp.]
MKTSLKLIMLASAPFMMAAASTTTYAPPKSPVYVVQSIECVQPTSGSDSDSIYISQRPDGARFPNRNFSMSAGDKNKVGYYFFPSTPGELVLFEDDTITDDDEIGRFKYHLGETSGTYTVTMKGDGGEYIVTIEVRR